ncbi:uncharacterized protein F5Z01DRAFT_196789 [Emericellopsis atlantica]|uniref:Fatty acid hydroxylase domain-containing protein n=1 Tax=Emericellopsis atlantica TaxID=2614577 RepID=A0A9P8CW64_9HYPO|nr:uncharacterized protein F5Z01DRAFT_196789 [Emericellopsis atlantica]KAG9258451.1 hypothetical protein F5Z01DRAFT_196789 [Emericellopsis atlantica]
MASKQAPQDSMKSTWRTADKSTWGFHHRLIDTLNVYPTNLDEPTPVHQKTEKIPHLPQSSQIIWVMCYSFAPMVLHQLWLRATGYEYLGTFATFQLYFTAFNAIIIRQIHVLRRLGHTWGYLDGDQHERDGVPDVGVGKIAASLYKTTGSRMALAAFLSYNPLVSPADVISDWQWWARLSIQIGLYSILLDFWFYWYHRAMHDVSSLWKFHRKHHLTKHPNALLSAYADHEQEFFDMVGVPFATCMTMWAIGLRLGFYEWWVCHQFVAFTEVWGHSGLRVHLSPPSTMNWLLEMFDCEIVVEDHDLHHRKGWRKSHNYGKQTRLWDRIFGTCTERIESIQENIDYEHTAYMPL